MLEYDIRIMINSFNKYCKKNRIKNRIHIHEDFPNNKLIKIMKPYLLLFYKSKYSFHPEFKILFVKIFIKSLIKFNNFNPKFGRRTIQILYKTDNNFDKIITGNKIVFNDIFIQFNNIEEQNNTFLIDHLSCEDVSYEFTSNDNINFDSEDEDDDSIS